MNFVEHSSRKHSRVFLASRPVKSAGLKTSVCATTDAINPGR